MQIRFRVRGKALGQRRNVRLVALGRAFRPARRLLDGLMRLHEAVFARRIVVVRTNGFRDAPIRHRQFGVQLRRPLERPRRLVMIERVNQPQPLIEKRLRLRILRRHRVPPISQSRHQSRCFVLRSDRMLVLLRRRRRP